MKGWLTRLLFDWVFVLLYRLFQGFLNLVDFIESFFDIFAGTSKVVYQGNTEFLINVFFGHDAVTNAFWAMALIAVVLAFGFCIVQMARKAADVAGSVKQTVGQILSNFFRCLLIIIMLNAVTVAVINITNVLLDRINYALENAAVLNQEEAEKQFTDEEYAAMVRVLATVANYSVNPSADSRYNVNSCFNAVRSDLLSLYVNGFFKYDYEKDANGHYSWQGALALLASSADLTTDLNLDTYYADVVDAYQTVSREISTYKDFAPVQSARFAVSEAIDTDVLIFLISGMEAAQNKMYNTGDFNDTIRKGYISGAKSYNNLNQVRKDFDIWEMDYLVGYIACIVFIIIMAICIFTFIVRMFNLLLLYLTAPLFASSMPLDDGNKWQNWTQAFVIQLFSGFGMVIAMRLYLIIIPIVISRDLVFFPGEGLGFALLNRMAQLLMVLGGAWAVLQSGSVITGILAGNPGMAAIQQEGRIGGMVTGWAMRAPRAAVGAAKSIASSPFKAARAIGGARDRAEQGQQRKVERLDRRAQQKQNRADALFDQANKRLGEGKHDRTTRGLMDRASTAQGQADKAKTRAQDKRSDYGLGAYQSRHSTPEQRFGGISSDAGDGFFGTPRTLGGKQPSSPPHNSKGPAAFGSGEKKTPPPPPPPPPPPHGRTPTPTTSDSGEKKPFGGRQMPPPPPPPPNRTRAADTSGGSGSDGFTGTPRTLGGSKPPPPPPPPHGRTQTPTTSDSGEKKSFGGRQMPPPPPPPPTRTRTADTSGGSGSDGFTGTPRTLGGRQMPPPPPPPPTRTRTADTSGGSGSDGFTGTPRKLGGDDPPPSRPRK